MPNFPKAMAPLIGTANFPPAFRMIYGGGGLPPIPGLAELVYGLTSMIDTGSEQVVPIPVIDVYSRVAFPSASMYRLKDIADNNDLSFTNQGVDPISITGRVYFYGRSVANAINVSVGTDNSGVDLPIINNSGVWRQTLNFVGGVMWYSCDYQVLLAPGKSVFPIVKNGSVSDFLVRSGKHRVWGSIV